MSGLLRDISLLQGWPKITFPGSVNMVWNNLVPCTCCRQKNATVSPHILTTWEGYFSPALYFLAGNLLRANKLRHSPDSCRPGSRSDIEVGVVGGGEWGAGGTRTCSTEYFSAQYSSTCKKRGRILLGFQNVFLQTESLGRTIMSQHFSVHPEVPRSGGWGLFIYQGESPTTTCYSCASSASNK